MNIPVAIHSEHGLVETLPSSGMRLDMQVDQRSRIRQFLAHPYINCRYSFLHRRRIEMVETETYTV